MKYTFTDGQKEFFVLTIKNPCGKKDFPREVNKDYFCDGNKLDNNQALQGLNGNISNNELLQLSGSQNYQYMWNNLVKYRSEDFEKDDFQGIKLFKQFIPLQFESFYGKSILIGCGGGGRDAYHILKFNPKMIYILQIVKIYYQNI